MGHIEDRYSFETAIAQLEAHLERFYRLRVQRFLDICPDSCENSITEYSFSHKMKIKEFELLEAISQDPLVTQASLSDQLGIAVGSVNWYIKRLVKRGYLSVSHLERTRLKYHLTPEGLAVLTQRTLQYIRNSLAVYNQLRKSARATVKELRARGVSQVYLDGDDEMMDILRLTCIELGLPIAPEPDGVALEAAGQDYRIVYQEARGPA